MRNNITHRINPGFTKIPAGVAPDAGLLNFYGNRSSIFRSFDQSHAWQFQRAFPLACPASHACAGVKKMNRNSINQAVRLRCNRIICMQRMTIHNPFPQESILSLTWACLLYTSCFYSIYQNSLFLCLAFLSISHASDPRKPLLRFAGEHPAKDTPALRPVSYTHLQRVRT